MIINVFRADPTNVGDWWSPPARYFKLGDVECIDIIKSERVRNLRGTVIVGGGGLGRPFFANYLAQLQRSDREYTLVSWGVGYDTEENRGGIVIGSGYRGEYFSDFDLRGSRAYPSSDDELWVPCSSCMWKGFDYFRNIKPSIPIGIYEHKRVPITSKLFQFLPRLTNYGKSIEEKVAFLANCQIVITNSYHGVYWATLLGRSVYCIPFKNGLYSFKHPPTYIDAEMSFLFEDSRRYPDALDECRMANVDFSHKVRELIDL